MCVNVLFVISISLVVAASDDDKCRVLSLSGGGSKGAYEVGVLHTLLTILEAPHNQYDVITGVSVGSINAAGYSLFDKGQELMAAEFMLNMWTNLTTPDIWKTWPNPVEGITEKPGYLDNSPLYFFLHRLMS